MGRSRQAGWAGLIVLLLALVIVAMLGKTLLAQSGLLGEPPRTAGATRGPGAAAAAGSETTDAASVTPRAALERARGLEATVREQARDEEARIDKATQ